MNRRFFLSALSALAAAPALPAVAAPILPRHMITAKIIARSHNRCTIDMLKRHLAVPTDMAARIQAQLLHQGVIAPPVSGVSLAIDPTNTGCIPNEAMKPNNLLQKAAQLREKLAQLDDSVACQEDQETPYCPEILTDNRSNSPSTS
ncbi:hypothetical protein [uncultured Sulfitobacter sp.]|uniref:hypothetical protein n=1 Tax=uncultured Sulfitobacter sp. TaxID=191468 RepID=UPI002639613E|nr:hypothetical protein [uncultured Sulfitobacter sp.]